MKKNIKVLHLISSLEQGGAERQLVELVKENKNHAICQLIPGGFYEEELNNNQTIIFNLNIKKNSFNIMFLYKLYKIIKNYKPDIINTWMYHSSLLEVFLRKITFKNDIPLVWGLRCSNMDTSEYSLALKMIIKGCKYFSNVPNIIINNSLAGLKFHESIGFKNNNIVIHNGIDIKKFSANNKLRIKLRNQLKIDNHAKVLLCVGRFDPMKDHDTLLLAFKRIKKNYKSIILILAGLGTENIKEQDGVIALGGYKDINHVYAASDIIVSSSAFGEGFSNAIAEGMASSLIPIATQVGDAEYIIGKIGKIVKPRNVKALCEAIKEILELDDAVFYNKRILSKKRITDKFSKSRMIKAYNEVYNQLLEE